MQQQLKKGDFIEVDYVGRIADSGEVFDTTKPDVAKEANVFNENQKYGPVIVQLGQNMLLRGLERQLEGKEVGKEYKFRVMPEEGFGKKTAKLIQLVSTSKFRQQKITPIPGLQVNIDGVVGTVKAVSGGRTIVDLNHPLAGRELEYDVVVKRIVTDAKEKISAMLKLVGIKAEVSIEGENAVIAAAEQLPEEIQKKLREHLTKSVSEIKSVEFAKKEEKQ
jgi:FKBP-type peptidyl-prolyl cis-trans isomerase 2